MENLIDEVKHSASCHSDHGHYEVSLTGMGRDILGVLSFKITVDRRMYFIYLNIKLSNYIKVS